MGEEDSVGGEGQWGGRQREEEDGESQGDQGTEMEAKAEMREEKGKMRNTKQRKEDTGGGQIARDSQAARDAERERERERERDGQRERGT
jgi:hypothetical protein